MTAQVQIKYPDAKLRRVEKLLRDFPRDLPRIMPRAINRTLRTTRAQGAREIKGDTPKLKVGDIKRRMFEDKAGRSHWAARLTMGDRPISLSRFAYKQTRAGVPFQIQAGRLVIRRAFRMPETGAVMIRNPQGQDTAWFDWRGGQVDDTDQLEPRLPITKLLGPSLSDLYTDAPATVSKVTRQAGATLTKNIDHEVDYALIRRLPR